MFLSSFLYSFPFLLLSLLRTKAHSFSRGEFPPFSLSLSPFSPSLSFSPTSAVNFAEKKKKQLNTMKIPPSLRYTAKTAALALKSPSPPSAAGLSSSSFLSMSIPSRLTSPSLFTHPFSLLSSNPRASPTLLSFTSLRGLSSSSSSSTVSNTSSSTLLRPVSSLSPFSSSLLSSSCNACHRISRQSLSTLKGSRGGDQHTVTEKEANEAVQGCLEVLMKKIEETAQPKRELLKRLRKEHGDVAISHATVNSICGGMRGLTAVLTETSTLDPEKGILYRGLSIEECMKQLPRSDPNTQ
ncbi:citrate synthase i, partial [Cystoisospora suis]